LDLLLVAFVLRRLQGLVRLLALLAPLQQLGVSAMSHSQETKTIHTTTALIRQNN
jgi:hypothetical protein